MPIVFAMRFCSLVVVLRKSKSLYIRSLLPCGSAASRLGSRHRSDGETRARSDPGGPGEELGPAHDDHLIAGFLERIDRELDRRVDERVARRGPAKRRGSPLHPGNLALCIPIVAIAGGIGGIAGLITALIALGTVFAVAELRR
jgi:hypothetical protein